MRYLLAILMVLACSDVLGATQLKKTVCPSGCDYTSLESCMNANEQNLVTADKYFDVEISGTWSSADTTAVAIHNYTTDATRYINIYTTGDARHDGRAASVSGRSNYRMNNAKIGITNGYVTIDGIENLNTNCGGSIGYVVEIGYGVYAHGNYVKNNIIHDFSGRCSGILNGVPYGYNDNYVYNNTIYNGRNDYQRGIYSPNGGGHVLSNIVYNVGSSAGQTTYGYGIGCGAFCKNNIAVGNGGTSPYDFGAYTGSANLNYNLSSDASASGANSLTSKLASNQFVSIGTTSIDLHLKAGADAIDAGTDLSGTFTTDIDGTTRSGTWDIGADEFVSAETPSYGMVLNGVYGGFYYDAN